MSARCVAAWLAIGCSILALSSFSFIEYCVATRLPFRVPSVVLFGVLALAVAWPAGSVVRSSLGQSSAHLAASSEATVSRVIRVWLRFGGGVLPLAVAAAVAWCPRCTADGLCMAAAVGWLGLVVAYGWAIENRHRRRLVGPPRSAGPLSCPQCGDTAMSMSQKLTLSPLSSIPCSACGQEVTLSSIAYLAVPILGGAGGFTFFLADNGHPLAAVCFFGGGVAMALSFIGAVPLIRAGE